jgi:alpha-ribazole phosphatase
MKFTVIRHSPTEHSVAGLFMGHLDIPPTQDSLIKAREVGVTLRHLGFNRYLSSPLCRAHQTAKALFPGHTIELCPSLKERGLGGWTGHSKTELRSVSPNAFLPSGFIDPFYTPPGGEPIDAFVARIKAVVQRLERGPDNDHVVAVTHNGVMRALRCILENRPLSEIFTESEPYLRPRCFEYVDGHWRHVASEHHANSWPDPEL